MSQIFNYLGFLGTILVALAYLPQIFHLIKEKCAYGISLKAWLIWEFAGLLMLPNALSSKAPVFTALLATQIVLGGIILYFAYRYQRVGACSSHSKLKE